MTDDNLGDYWAAHPMLADWQFQVANDDTRLGFWEWVAAYEEEEA